MTRLKVFLYALLCFNKSMETHEQLFKSAATE